jgi:hypothetical protein
MTTFTGPLNVKKEFAQTTVVAIGVSGGATFAQGNYTIGVGGTASPGGGLSGLTIVNATVTASSAVSAGTGGDAVPASAEAWMEVSINGTTYMIALFLKAT